MYNLETQATLGTQDTEQRQAKTNTQHRKLRQRAARTCRQTGGERRVKYLG